MTEQTDESFASYSEEKAACRRARRIHDCLDRISDAVDDLSFQFDAQTSPDQLDRIEWAVKCLRADLKAIAD